MQRILHRFWTFNGVVLKRARNNLRAEVLGSFQSRMDLAFGEFFMACFPFVLWWSFLIS